jgi:hypothetical protein
MRDHPLVQLTLSQLRGFYREPEAVFWVFGFPILLAFALGIAFRNRGPEALQVGVVAGAGDSAVVASLAASPHRSRPTRASAAWRRAGSPCSSCPAIP